MTPAPVATDRGKQSQRGKRIFAQELAEFIERALNYILKGKGMKPGLLKIKCGSVYQWLWGSVLTRAFGLTSQWK